MPREPSRRARLGRMLAVVVLVLGVGFAVTGGIGRTLGALESTVTGMVDSITATPTPRPTVVLIADPPELAKPLEPYTNQQQVDVQVSLPPNVAGSAGTVRLRLGLPEGEVPLTLVQEVPIGPDDVVVIPGVPLAIGRNDFTATIVNSAGESDPSPVVTYVLDLAKPPLEVDRPADGEVVNADTVTVAGGSQGRATIVARNGQNGANVSVLASTEGTFEVELPLVAGPNQIGLTATDPAGNVATKLFTVVRGDGTLEAALTIEPDGIDIDNLPQPITVTVLVTDPDGKPLEGAAVTYTLSVPSIQVITSDAVTDASGTAVFETNVPQGATAGESVVAVLVRSEEHGEATATLELEAR